MILFADYNTPYLFAISFVLLIGLLEILALICGHMLSGALDAHLDHYDSITTGHISQALHYLNIGRLPALVVLCLLAGFFGLIGILLQHACIMVWQSPLSNLFVVPVSLLFTIIAVHYTGKIVAPWIPRDHSSAITEEEYIGSMALITGHQATSEPFCRFRILRNNILSPSHSFPDIAKKFPPLRGKPLMAAAFMVFSFPASAGRCPS